CVLLSSPGGKRDRPCFPTRRSSDLGNGEGGHRLRSRHEGRRGRGSDQEAVRAGIPQPSGCDHSVRLPAAGSGGQGGREVHPATGDRKNTRLNSSHVKSSYAVFCLKE